MTHQPHTPEKEIWTTGPMTGEVQSNVPQFEGQDEPHLVCYGIGNSEAAGLIANAPGLWRKVELLERLHRKDMSTLLQSEKAREEAVAYYEGLEVLLERAWPYLHDLTTCAPDSMYGHNQVENLIQEIKTAIGHEQQPAPISPA